MLSQAPLRLSPSTGFQIFRHGFQISKHDRAYRHVILGPGRILKKRRKEGPLAMQNYSQVNQLIRRKMKQAKENCITYRCSETDCGIRTGNIKTAFNTLKLLTQRQQTKTNFIENAKDTLLTEENAIHKRWTEYCTEPYNYKLKTDASMLKSEDDIANRETIDSPYSKRKWRKRYGC